MEGGILILLCWGKYLCKISLMPFWVNFQKSGTGSGIEAWAQDEAPRRQFLIL